MRAGWEFLLIESVSRNGDKNVRRNGDFMSRISLLDCTLRDGGYLNDWEFGHGNIVNIFERLVSAELDIIEIGFMNHGNMIQTVQFFLMQDLSTKLMLDCPKGNQ